MTHEKKETNSHLTMNNTKLLSKNISKERKSYSTHWKSKGRDFPLPLKWLKVHINAIIEQQGIKCIRTGNEEIKLSLFIDDKTAYKEVSEECTYKLFQLRTDYNQFAKYKDIT